MKNYKNYLHNVAGFFIVEATVLQTSNDLIAAYDVMALWDAALAKVKALLQQDTVRASAFRFGRIRRLTVELFPQAYCDDVAILSELKDFLLVFARTLRKYGYDLSPISEFTKAPLRDRFILVSTTNVTNECSRLLALPEAYQPYVPPGEFEIRENIVAHKFETLFERGWFVTPSPLWPFWICSVPIADWRFF